MSVSTEISVPLLDLKAQYAGIRDEVMEAVREVFEDQWFILGPKVQECEARIAEYCRCEHAVGVSSGTDALLIALMAEGIGPDDEVITTPYTFFATAGCIARVGATPVFVDICPRTYNLDTRKLEAAVTAKTKAIVPIHLFGQCADMDAVCEVAEEHGLVVIEDAAQAIGAELKGRRAGSMGHYGCFSFFPSKNLGAAGDGGIVVTNDPERAERLAILRGHGAKPKYYHSVIGGNFRLDALQAAVVLVKLKYLDDWSAGRRANAETYRNLFKEAGLTEDDRVVLPYAIPDGRHIYNQFVIRVPRRDELREHLKENRVATEIYYPVPLHRQECFAYLGHAEGEFPEAERAARETLALPIYPELTDEQQRHVVGKIEEFLEG